MDWRGRFGDQFVQLLVNGEVVFALGIAVSTGFLCRAVLGDLGAAGSTWCLHICPGHLCLSWGGECLREQGQEQLSPSGSGSVETGDTGGLVAHLADGNNGTCSL